MNRKERKDLKEKQMLSFEIFAFSAADVAPCWLSEISCFFTASDGRGSERRCALRFETS